MFFADPEKGPLYQIGGSSSPKVRGRTSIVPRRHRVEGAGSGEMRSVQKTKESVQETKRSVQPSERTVRVREGSDDWGTIANGRDVTSVDRDDVSVGREK